MNGYYRYEIILDQIIVLNQTFRWYFQFLDVTLHSDNNITTGKIYQHVINKERKGDYLGKTVQVVPHITDAIQAWVSKIAEVPVSGEQPEVSITKRSIFQILGVLILKSCEV